MTTPIKPTAKKHIYITFDTETCEGFLGDAICSQWTMFDEDFNDYKTNTPITKSANSIDNPSHSIENPIKDFFEDIYTTASNVKKQSHKKDKKFPKVTVFIHNSHFDNMRVIKQGEVHGVAVKEQLVMGQTIFGSYKYKDLRIEFRDTAKMFVGSLQSLSDSLSTYLPKIDKDHFEGFDITSKDDIDYALRDVVTLKHVLYNYSQLLGVPLKKLKATAPSQAFDLLKQSYAVQAIKKRYEWKPRVSIKGETETVIFGALPKDFNNILAKYYRGGRVLIKEGLNILERHTAVSLDETSAYPFCMGFYTYPLPGKLPVRMIKKPTAKGGRYLVEMDVFNYYSPLPILPFKKDWDNQKEAAIYPHGSFRTYLTDLEYEFYLKQPNNGQHTPIEFIYWSSNKCDYWLRPFVEKYYKMKEEGDRLNSVDKEIYENTLLELSIKLGKSVKDLTDKEKKCVKLNKSGAGLRETAKLTLNSAYGKFGQKYVTEDTAIYYNDFIKDDSDEFNIEKQLRTDHRNFHIAAFITGAARVRLYECIDFYGVENNLYSDTDSVKITPEAYAEKGDFYGNGVSPDELGGWKFEGMFHNLCVKAPKVYCYQTLDDNGQISDTYIKAKGLPMKDATFVNEEKFNFNVPESERKLETKRMKEFVYNLMVDSKEVKISYGAKPVQAKTFNKTGVYAAERIGSITDPHSVTGYKYDELTTSYKTHVVGETC